MTVAAMWGPVWMKLLWGPSEKSVGDSCDGSGHGSFSSSSLSLPVAFCEQDYHSGSSSSLHKNIQCKWG